MLLESIAEGHPELVLRDSKLRLACELYLSSHFESTPVAAFLSRIMTLEDLVGNDEASPPVKDMVRRFKCEAISARNSETDFAIRSEYESVISRLAPLRARSIKSQNRRLVESTLQSTSHAEESVSNDVSRLYDLCSTLVHTGKADPEVVRCGNKRLGEIVPIVLKVS